MQRFDPEIGDRVCGRLIEALADEFDEGVSHAEAAFGIGMFIAQYIVLTARQSDRPTLENAMRGVKVFQEGIAESVGFVWREGMN